MGARTAVALAATIIALKAVLIGVLARGRCQMVGLCGDGTTWYVGSAVAASVLGVLLVLTIADARRP